MQNYLAPLPRNIHMVKNLIKDTNTFDITKPPSHEKASVGKPIIKAREILDEHLPTNALGEKADLTSFDEELSAFKLESVTRIALIYQNSLSDLSDLSDLPTIPVKLTKSLYNDPSRPRMFAKELNKEKHFTPTKDGVELGDSFPQFPLCELQKNITDWVQQVRKDVK